MSAIQDCLSRFTVAVWSNAPSAVDDIDRAISAYLEAQGPDRSARLRALETLKDCYGRVATSSPLTDTVRVMIDRRLTALGPTRSAA